MGRCKNVGSRGAVLQGDVEDAPDGAEAAIPFGGGTVMIEFSRDVSSAFELLMGRVQAEIDAIHRDGSEAFAARQYEKARQAATQAEQLYGLDQKLSSLRKQWQDLANAWMESSLVEVHEDTPVGSPVEPAAGPGKAEPARTGEPGAVPVKLTDPENPTGVPERRTRWTATTQEREFYRPILEALIAMGGSSKKGEILDRVGQALQGVLTAVDCSPIRGGDPKTPLWRITAEAAKRPLVREGFLKGDSPKDTWEITDRGRQAVAQSSAA